MHKMRKKRAYYAQERDKNAQKMASQKVPQIVAKSVPLLSGGAEMPRTLAMTVWDACGLHVQWDLHGL